MKTGRLDSLSNGLALLLTAIVTASVLLSFFFTEPEQAGPAFSFLRILLICGVGVFLIHWIINSSRLSVRFSFKFLVLLLFGCLTLVSAWMHSSLFQGTEQVQFIVIAILAFGVSSQFGGNNSYKWMILCALTAGAASVAVFGLDQFFYQFDLIQNQIDSGEINLERYSEPLKKAWLIRLQSREVFASFVNPNTFGAVMALFVLGNGGLAYFFFRKSADNRNALFPASLFTVYGILSVTGLILSGSRGAVLALAGGCVFFVCAGTRLGRAIKYTLCVIALTGCMILLFLPFAEESIKVREGYWSGASRIIGNNPLTGVGPGNFWHYYTEVKPVSATEVKVPHNILLRLWSESGPASVLLFIVSFLALLWKGGRKPDKADRLVRSEKLLPFSPAFGAFTFSAFIIISLMPGWDCSIIGTLGVFVILMSGFILYIMIRRVPLPDTEIITDILRAAVFLILLHSLIDFTLSVPSVFFIVLIIASLLPHGSPALTLGKKEGTVAAVLCIIIWIPVYWNWGRRNFDCRMNEITIRNQIRDSKYLQALQGSSEAVKRFPEMDIFYMLGERCSSLAGNKQLELDFLEKLVSLYERSASAYFRLGTHYAEREMITEACEAFRKSTEYYPGHPWYRLEYAQTLFNKGDIKESLTQLLLGISLDRETSDPLIKYTENHRKKMKHLSTKLGLKE